MNKCVRCGADISEDMIVCDVCINNSLRGDTKKIFMFPGRCNGKSAAMTKYIRLDISDIRTQAVDEFVQSLKDRIHTDVMPKFRAEGVDSTYKVGAEICEIDIEILISKLLREFKEKEYEKTHSD